MNNHWVIPPPGTTCENCGYDMSSHTGPCVTVETLKNALGEGEGRAEATVNGMIMRVERYVNSFDNSPFWIWGYAENWSDPYGTDVTLDGEGMEDELFGDGFDPDAWIWIRQPDMTTPLIPTVTPISL